MFTVHSVPGSPFGRAVLATLIEKGAPFRFAPVDPRGMKVEPHLGLHPFGRVPVVEHDGFTLYETQAILRYIDRVVPNPALTPAEPKAAARMDQVMNISDWYLFQGVANVIGFERIVKPQMMGAPADEAAIAAALPRAGAVVAALSQLLEGRSYFAGEALSLADLLVAPHVDFLAATPEWAGLADAAPQLVAWFERMLARPSLIATTWERVAGMAQAA